MSWRMAKSLEKLLAQLNEMFPNRSKISDGGIADLRHQKIGTSDHLPNKNGVVTARDFTFDANPEDGVGINCQHLADALVKSRDKRIKYIIWNGRICSSLQSPWTWRKYSGTNPHNHHLHLSVIGDSALCDSVAEWNLDGVRDEQKLPRTYTAQPGDSVTLICKKFGLKTNEFYQINNFTVANFDADKIRDGDIFKV